MDSAEVLQELAQSIEQSRHKDLVCAGLSAFSGFLKGEEVDITNFNESLKTSIKILAEDIDEEMSAETIAPGNPHIPAMRRYTGKCVKKELLKSVGESLSEDEIRQYNSAKREIVEILFDYL